MRLHRFGLVTFRNQVPAIAPWGYTTDDGVEVLITSANHPLRPSADTVDQESIKVVMPTPTSRSGGTEMTVVASVPAKYEQLTHSQVRISDEPRVQAERALSDFAAIIGVMAEEEWRLYSPRPYLGLSAESEYDRAVLAGLKRIVLPKTQSIGAYHGWGLDRPLNFISELGDRWEGVRLLGSAIGAGNGLTKLHELFRLFESAFKKSGRNLPRPLSSFLASYPHSNLGYTEAEISHWVTGLRDPATHADRARSKAIVHESDVWPFLYRIEQAAYDVLFNKATWGDPGQMRKTRWHFGAAENLEGHFQIFPGAGMRVEFKLDHFGVYPLCERVTISTPDDGNLFLADWYLPDGEHERLDAELLDAGISI